MRRVFSLCVVLLAMFAAAASASPSRHHTAGTQSSPPVLLGNQAVSTVQDGGQGTSEAFGYTAGVSGTAATITVYLDSSDGVRLGLYSDNGGQPGQRLDRGHVNSNTPGWVSVPLYGNVQLTSGTRYWLVVAALTGSATVGYRDNGWSGTSLDYSGAGMRNPYYIYQQWSSNPATVYVSGPGSPPPPPVAPANTGLPQISGNAQQGSTLASSTGTWTGTAQISYGYQWQSCDSSAGNCAAISGATSANHLLAGSDVGHTIRVLVTATNAGGSTAASTAASSVVASSAPSPPVNTVAPGISGTAQQGQALTASGGSWSGSAPITYTYQWQRNAASNISGATSATYSAVASDVGQRLDVVVTAQNSGGQASASSPQTAVVTASQSGGLPGGVSLQQLDGGPNYYGHFSNSWSDSTSFYPIAVFNQTLGYNNGSYDPSQLAAYKAEGVNGFVNLYNGYNQALLSAIRAANMWVIAAPLAPSYAANTLTGYVWFDEADGNNDCGSMPSAAVLGESVPCSATSDGRTPSTAIAQATADLHGARGAGDPTRFVYGQYTKPVARGEGLSNAQAAAYVNAADVISYDDYLISDGWESDHNLWEQADLVAHVRSLGAYNHPVLPFIEAGEPFTSDQWSGITPTPAMSVAEAWNAIIGGARGIQWFDHDFGGSSGGYASSSDDLIDPNPVFASLQSAVAAFDARVTGLAPVINSPFANGYVTSAGGPMNVMAKYYAAANDFYVFAAPRSNSSQNVTFTVAGGYTGPVSVQGENRTVQAANGVFSDTFADQTAVHVYTVPNG